MGLFRRKRRSPLSDWLNPRYDERYLVDEVLLTGNIRLKDPAPYIVNPGRVAYGDPGMQSPTQALLWVSAEQFQIALAGADLVLTCPFRFIYNVQASGETAENLTITTRGYLGPLVPDPGNPNNEAHYWIGFGPNLRLRGSLLDAIQKIEPIRASAWADLTSNEEQRR